MKQTGELEKLEKIDTPRDASYPRIAGFGPLGTWTSKKELDFLSRYSLLICGCDNVPEKLLYLKSKNPNLIILYYISATINSLKNPKMRPEFWLRDPKGQLIQPRADSYVGNQTLPEVNELIIKRAQEILNALPQLDGFYIDDFTPGIGHINNGQIDADGDGKKDKRGKLDKAWIEGLLRIVHGIKAIRQGVIVIGNGGGPLKFGYDVLNGVVFENLMRTVQYEGRHGSPDTADKLLTAYQRWGGIPSVPRVILITDGAGNIHYPKEWQKLSHERKIELRNLASKNIRLMRLNLGFTLMGDGYAAFNFGHVSQGERWWYPEWDIKIGMPLGPVQKLDGYWMRKFKHAVVYVNPYPEPVQIKDNNKEFLLPAFDGKITPK